MLWPCGPPGLADTGSETQGVSPFSVSHSQKGELGLKPDWSLSGSFFSLPHWVPHQGPRLSPRALRGAGAGEVKGAEGASPPAH